jgi:uncharacterized protein
MGATAAGTLSGWLVGMEQALAGRHGSEVPCDGCTACCRASQFIHIEPDEAATLARVPASLRFPAPGLPAGHVVMGYDQHGHCPMLVDDCCSIYDDRPRACRTYDCRVFPATGLEPDGVGQEPIVDRVRRWRFDPETREELIRHDALRLAAAYLGNHPEVFPSGAAPVNTTQLAVLAVELHEQFLAGEPDPGSVRVQIDRHRQR